MKNNIISRFLNKQSETTIQFIKYVFVGGTAFILDFSTYFFFTDIVHIHYLLASTFSFIVGLITNYTLGTLFVFGSRKVEKRRNEFLLVALISVGGMLLTLLLLWMFTELMHVHYLTSKVIASVLVLVYNFSLRKKVIYN
jgi:putative flippase GtrA